MEPTRLSHHAPQTQRCSHQLDIRVECCCNYPTSTTTFCDLTIRHNDRCAQFKFLINCGWLRPSSNLSTVSASSTERESFHGTLHHLDAVLLSGSRKNDVEGLPLVGPLLKEANVPVLATDPTYKFTKLTLYNQILQRQTQRSVVVTSLPTDMKTSAVLSNTTTSTLDEVDAVLSRVRHVRYYENVIFTKPWTPSTHDSKTNDHSSLPQHCELHIQAVPSGMHLGASAWLLMAEGEYAAVLTGTAFTIKPNWFFDGLDVKALPKSPSIIVAGCPFTPPSTTTMRHDDALLDLSQTMQTSQHLPQGITTQLSVPLSHLPTLTAKTAAHQVLALTKRTLQKGGSVCILVPFGLEALKLLILFQSAWTAHWKIYPLYFVSPTGSLLLDFAKTMLDWMSLRYRDAFCATRRNPFHNFDSVRAVSSAAGLGPSAGVPRVMLTTAEHLESGGIVSLASWLTLCEDPQSALIFLTPPSPEDLKITEMGQELLVEELKHKQLPADNLYRMYLEERLTREPDAISEESERPNPAESSVPDLEAGDTFSIDGEEDVAAHQKFEAVKVDEIKKDESVLLEAFLGSSLATQRLDLTQNLNASEDQYGTALMANEDDWADLRYTTCQHDADQPCTNGHFGVPEEGVVDAEKHHKLRFLNNTYAKNSETQSDGDASSPASSKRSHQPVASKDQIIPHWRKLLRQWYHGKDPSSETVETRSCVVRASRYVILGLFDQDTTSRVCDAQSFAEWLSPFIYFRPKNVILYPTAFDHLLLLSLMRTGMQNQVSCLPNISVCQPSNVLSSVKEEKNSFWFSDDTSLIATGSVQWNELLVGLSGSTFAQAFQMHQASLQQQGPNDQAAHPRFQSLVTVPNTLGDDLNPNQNRSRKCLMSAAFIPLLVTSSEQLQLADGNVPTENSSEPQKLTFSALPPIVCAAESSPSLNALSTAALSCSSFSTVTQQYQPSPWISIGNVAQRHVLQSLLRNVPSEAIITKPNFIALEDRAAVTFQTTPNSDHQLVHLHGGLDFTTLLLKQKLQESVQSIGTLFPR